MNGFDKFDKLIEVLGCGEVLENLLKALTEQEREENADYIARMYDINIED